MTIDLESRRTQTWLRAPVAVVAAVAIAGAGWYIALGAVAGFAGVLGGLLYGVFELPRVRFAAPARAAVI